MVAWVKCWWETLFTKWLSFSRDKDTKETGDILCKRKQGVSFTGIILTRNYTVVIFDKYIQNISDFLTLRASVSSFRTALVSLFPLSARVSRCGRAASVGRSRRNASSVSSVKPSSKLTMLDAWRCRCAHRRSMSRAARGIPERSKAPLDRGADSTAFKLEQMSKY